MSRILVIDDEDVIRMLVMEILESAGHDVTGADSAECALGLLEESDFDLVVSDVVMPGLSGLELLEAVRARRASLPVVLVTGAGTYDTLSQALTRGAAGLVTKPFAHAELQSAVTDALERASRSREELRERLLAPTLASALANAIEARDSYLHGHCERLAALAVRMAELLGLRPDEVETVRLGAILHDVGKIGIPDRVLLKPGKLDEEERRIVETHPEIGDKLLEPLDLLASARPIVRHHHERWDGAGYPDGLAAGAGPLRARLLPASEPLEGRPAGQLDRPARRLCLAGREPPARRGVRRGRGRDRGHVGAPAVPPAALFVRDRRGAARGARHTVGSCDRRPRARSDRFGRARAGQRRAAPPRAGRGARDEGWPRGPARRGRRPGSDARHRRAGARPRRRGDRPNPERGIGCRARVELGVVGRDRRPRSPRRLGRGGARRAPSGVSGAADRDADRTGRRGDCARGIPPRCVRLRGEERRLRRSSGGAGARARR